ncbi:MAG: segregation and condensation protein A [Acidimicrobiales bacterium]
MAYEVQTEVYQGPFDLLLQLILQDEVELYEISLIDIVDAYLAELERMEMCDLDVATEFLLIAATLVELKTRRLLPDDREFDLEDEFGLWEHRDLLLSKLLECKTFKDAAIVLRRMSAEADRSYARRAGLDEAFIGLAPDLLTGVTAIDVRDAYVRALTPRPEPRVDLFHVDPITVTVHDAVVELLDELPRVQHISFRDLTEGLVDRIEVVVRFLAVLELFKQNLVDVEQVRTFGEIAIRWIGTPEAVAELEIDRYEG